MKDPDLDPILEKVSEEISDFTVGFVLISVHEINPQAAIEDATPAGSGTLVTVGSIGGILTAAHVVRNLPTGGKVGLVRFPKVQPTLQRTTIDMALTDRLIIDDADNSATGPDLGFLRLPSAVISSLSANNVFFNLSKRRDEVLSTTKPSGVFFDGIAGVIAEWTMDLPDEGPVAVKGFKAMYGVGVVERQHEANGFDLYDFETTYGPGQPSPRSFGGMSGGGLWRVCCTKNSDGGLSVTNKRLIGVAFFESGLSDDKNIITCHGPKSVYGNLIDAIHEKWPPDSD